MHLFDGVYYLLSPSLPSPRSAELIHVLDHNGAVQVESLDDPALTHFITNSNRFEKWQQVAAREGAGTLSVTTDKWVDRSMLLGKLQSPLHYSADPAMIFSGVVACAAELPTPDLEVLSAGITALGGQWRTGLTKDVTHLFAISTSSPKYSTALHYQDHTQIKVLLPHWFDDAVRLGMGSLDTASYEWPDPALLKGPDTGEGEEKQKEDALKRAAMRKVDPDKKMLYKTASLWSPDSPLPPTNAPSSSAGSLPEPVAKDVWQGRRILLGRSLELVGGRQEAVEVGIQRAGGIVVTPEAPNEVDEIDKCDVFVTRYRSGKAYVKAVRQAKTIGTLPWLFHVQSTGVLAPPMDQLLWYPIPKRPIEGFSGHEITVTNYTGESREYLKKLITTMGATFTPSMSGKNTVLIAAYISGTKTSKAASWSIPIVNHTWLEDCFVKWRSLTVALEKYIVFPPGVDFSGMLGERGVGRAVEEIGEDELELLEEEDAEEDAEEMSIDGMQGDVQKKSAPFGTQNSARDAREVEEAVGMDVDVPMADDHLEVPALEVEEHGMDLDNVQVPQQEEEEQEEEQLTPPKSSKSLATRLREKDKEKDESPAKTRIRPRKVFTAKKRAPEPSPSRTPTPEIRVMKRKSGQLEVSPLRKRVPNTSSAESEHPTSSDEVEVVRVVTSSRKKLVRRADEGHTSWIDDIADSPTQKGKAKRVDGDSSGDVEEGKRVTTKAVTSPKKANRVYSEDDHDMEVEAGPSVSKAGKKKPTLKKKFLVSDDEENEPVKSANGRSAIASTSTLKSQSAAKSKKHLATSDEDHTEESEADAVVEPTAKTRSKGKEPEKKQTRGKPKPRGKPQPAIRSDPESEDEDEDERPPPPSSGKKRISVKAPPPSSKSKKQVESEDEADEDEDATPPPVPTKKGPPKTRPKRASTTAEITSSRPSPSKTPKRIVSVLLPHLTLSTHKSPPKVREEPTTTSHLTRTESIRAAANELATGRSGKGRPAAITSGSKTKSKPTPEPPTAASSSPAPTVDDEASTVFSGRSKRNAAAKATQKLHDEIMPDVMNYQHEMRNKGRKSVGGAGGVISAPVGNARKKKRSSDAKEDEEDDDDRHDKEAKRRRLSVPDMKKGKKRADSETEDEDAEPSKPTRTKGKGKNKKETEEEESDTPVVVTKADAKTKKGVKTGDDGSSSKQSGVRIMTTQVTLSDDVVKTLTKLGAKITTRPVECTHLLAPNLVRTEKFLCALAGAPFILTGKWATDSAAKKKLLDEKDYLLHDDVGENKYEVVLADALARAKELRGGLFRDTTFYVTPKVSLKVDVKLLRNVVTACGGQVKTEAPTLRILSNNPDRHAISCPEDKSIWSPIARGGHPVYTHELILTAALRQEIDWDDEKFRVLGSQP